MAESGFASFDEIVVDQLVLKLNAKKKNTTKSTQMWLNVWGDWVNERKFNPKLEEYNEHKDLDKKLQMSYAEVRTKDGSCNFENFKNITRAQISRGALAFTRFPILIEQIKSLISSAGLGGQRKKSQKRREVYAHLRQTWDTGERSCDGLRSFRYN